MSTAILERPAQALEPVTQTSGNGGKLPPTIVIATGAGNTEGDGDNRPYYGSKR
jgi:hypothetical protein